MTITRRVRSSILLGAVLALVAAIAAQAASSWPDPGRSRMLLATDKGGNLIGFHAKSPQKIRWKKSISGLPDGVSLRGIDFRPATGDLYGSAATASSTASTRTRRSPSPRARPSARR